MSEVEVDLVLHLEKLGLKEAVGESFDGYTLFLPAVSVGNVGQLALDLVLENVSAPPVKIGRMFHPCLEAVVGSDIQTRNSLMTACEVFQVKESKYLMMHFHSPVTMRGRSEFVQSLAKWIQQNKFAQVVCFSSIFAADRIDTQLVGEPFRYLVSDVTPAALLEKIKGMRWKQLERRQFPAPAVLDPTAAKDEMDRGILHLPGSGITNLLYEECQSKKIPFLALIMFASEGDNTPEAMTLFQMAEAIFEFRPQPIQDGEAKTKSGMKDKLKIPISWAQFEDDRSYLSLY